MPAKKTTKVTKTTKSGQQEAAKAAPTIKTTKDPKNKRVVLTIARRGDGTSLVYLSRFLNKETFKAVVKPVLSKLNVSQYKCTGKIQELDRLPGSIITVDFNQSLEIKDVRKIDVESIDGNRIEVRKRNLDFVDKYIKSYTTDPDKTSILGTPLKSKAAAQKKKAANA